MEDLLEATAIAETILSLENAKSAYLDDKSKFEGYTGLRRPLGWLGLKGAEKEAVSKGLLLVNENVIVPGVVSNEYFSSIDDDVSFSDRKF